jgi:FkbM family methyltransferase
VTRLTCFSTSAPTAGEASVYQLPLSRHAQHMFSHATRCSYFGYIALASQCGSVYFFDPQPLCAHSIAAAITKNGFDNAYVVTNPVTDIPGTTMEVDSRFNCNGRWPIQQDEVGTDPKSTVVVQAVTLLQILPTDFSSIYFVKVDTEGGELAVLHSLMPYILKKKVL